ncbi:predicted protein [Naegleria gruberi]|uniref:Predicted protein n=1 Tax=Naegleria gruberi TaxID=5762 RepID=D2VT27_NAEGR|nr:uncharacterized protein NAEGRDRAFT_72151 [Naegleria gruberi]EFC40074.1 predicted protein [Naegleria gruberi]|eukprot:XP_002672818.1 predicted protein [Naegleria gruberi strain NEG-M]
MSKTKRRENDDNFSNRKKMKQSIDAPIGMKSNPDLFPDDICYEILTFLDSSMIIQSCLLISRNWHEVIKNRAKLSVDLEVEDKIVENIVKSGIIGNIVELKLVGNSVCRIRTKGAQLISQNLTQLTNLDLSYNSIGDEGAKHISTMANLTSLNICSNRIGYSGSFSVFGMKNLISLDLSYSAFSLENDETFQMNVISQSKTLKSLRVRYSDLNDRSVEKISEIKQLTKLDVSNCPNLSVVGVKFISQMENLNNLNISCNYIGDEGAKIISEMSQLTDLNISYSKIGNTGAMYISQLGKLTTLNISTNNIGAEGAKSLSHLSQLTDLNINANNIETEGFLNIILTILPRIK